MRSDYVAIEFRRITKVSILSGKTHTRTIGAAPEHWVAWKKGELIQRAFPDMAKDDREFLLSGSTPEEWETLKPEDE